MKRTLSMIILAVLTIGLLGSCSKINERLDNLDKRIDGIENEQIATINGQIDGIKNSIKDLGQIRDDISGLKQTAESHGQDIFALQEADEVLGNRIDNLEDYLKNVLPNYAEKEWVKATYSTLEQYDSTCTAIAEINAKIGELDTKLTKDIKACADSMTEWINTKFKGYYTAAEMDAKLAQIKASVDSAKASGKITDTKADSVAAELTKTKTAVDTAKSHIRSEYKAAIKTAIDSSEGRLTKKIQEEIAKVNDDIDALAISVNNLNNAVLALAGRVGKLEEMIQSVAIVPAYSDGSVKVLNDSLHADFIVSPSKAVSTLEAGNVAVLVNKVKTKANTGVDTIRIIGGNVFERDADKGVISVRVFIKNRIPAAADSTITIAVNVNNGISNFTTDFVPLTIPVSVSLDKCSIVVPFSASVRDTTLIATVKNSSKGVNWESSNENIASVNNAGKVTIKADASGKDTIVVTTVEGNATDTCFLTIIPEGFKDLGVVVAGKPLYWAERNLGATNPGDYGDYFAWGATELAYSDLSSNTFTFIDSRPDSYGGKGWDNESGFNAINTPFFDESKGDGEYVKYDGSDFSTLEPSDDAATRQNSSWRIPTTDEFVALAANCVWIWADSYNSTGVKGCIVYKAKNDDDKGKVTINGNTWKKWNGTNYQDDSKTTETYSISDTHIFLPAAGQAFIGTSLQLAGSSGCYWSSTLNPAEPYNAYYLTFGTSGNVLPQGNYVRSCGYSVRPVAE